MRAAAILVSAAFVLLGGVVLGLLAGMVAPGVLLLAGVGVCALMMAVGHGREGVR